MTNPRDPDFALRVARLRFEADRSPHEIAELLGISVSTVSRALKQARDLGFIRIRVVAPSDRLSDLEHAVEKRFGLALAVVVRAAENEEQNRHRLGQEVAEELVGLLRPHTVIGVSDGRTTAAVAQHMTRLEVPGLDIVPLIGGVGMADAPTHPHEVARQFAAHVGARTWQLPVPAMVDNGKTAATLMGAPIVRSAFEIIDRCSVALVGVGSISPEASIVRHGVVTADDIMNLGTLGAVGSICARFYGEDGHPVASQFDARTLAVTLDNLKTFPYRIAVAVGDQKVRAIRAALRGRIVNCLGTDEPTARRMLAGD
ncbi:MAG: sugar-binding transcriptional regulator [Rhodospirillales bacterium]|nr:sugar-binding transcriptional regulator [Rhodospirillales bacterium]